MSKPSALVERVLSKHPSPHAVLERALRPGLPPLLVCMGVRPSVDVEGAFVDVVPWLDPTESDVVVSFLPASRPRDVALRLLEQARRLCDAGHSAPAMLEALRLAGRGLLWAPIVDRQLTLRETLRALARTGPRGPELARLATCFAADRVGDLRMSASELFALLGTVEASLPKVGPDVRELLFGGSGSKEPPPRPEP